MAAGTTIGGKVVGYVTAAALSKSGTRSKDVDSVVREQLASIDDRLLRHERSWGRNIVKFSLPVNFVLPGLQKKDAQRIVYAAILRSLLDRGFEVKLTLDEAQHNTLYIAWET